jgi:hypothetical protein
MTGEITLDAAKIGRINDELLPLLESLLPEGPGDYSIPPEMLGDIQMHAKAILQSTLIAMERRRWTSGDALSAVMGAVSETLIYVLGPAEAGRYLKLAAVQTSKYKPGKRSTELFNRQS